MKQLFAILSALLLTCCSKGGEAMAQTQEAANLAGTLIVYYSYTGNCREIANTLSSQIEADVVEVQPAEKGLRYEANNYALGTQLLNAINANPDDAGSYPAIDPVEVNLKGYQNVIIVTPLWWSQMAAIMQTFLFQNSAILSGKSVGLIVSSYSSGISRVVADAKRLLHDVPLAGDALWINNGNHSKRASLIEAWLPTQNFQTTNDMTQELYLTIDGVTKTATLVGNSSAEALVAQLQKGNITYEAHDYGDFEKVGPLGYTFPQNNTQITTEPGDLILYLGSNLCIYYDENSWNFTRIGKLVDMTQDEIKAWVKAGGENVKVTLSLSNPTGMGGIKAGTGQAEAYSLGGVPAQDGQKGIIVQKGKKTLHLH